MTTAHRTVSVTELIDFQDCHRKWALRHQMRLQPKKRPPNLASGTVVHEAIGLTLASKEYLGVGHVPYMLPEKLLLQEFKTDEDSGLANSKKYLPGVKHALEQCPDWLWESVWHVESPLSMPVPVPGLSEELTLVGRPDLYRELTTSEGDPVIELVEIKTTNNDPLDYLLWNAQHRYYATMLQRGNPAALVRFRYLCLPTQGKAKDHSPWVLTHRMYERTVEVLTRRCIAWSGANKEAALNEPNEANRCKWCDFNPICSTEIIGGSMESAIAADFNKRPKRGLDKPLTALI